MALIEQKFIEAGTYFSATGYVSSSLPGTISDTLGGSQNNSLTDLYANSTCNGFYLNTSSNVLTLSINDVSGNVTNSGWDTVTIGSNTFNRADATYSVTGSTDKWEWSGASGTFVNGSSYSVEFRTTPVSGLTEEKFIAAGSYFSATGYVSASLPGTISDTLGGSQNNSLTDLYPNSTCSNFYLNTSSNLLSLIITDVSGNVTNSGWDTVDIGSNTFNRADATYSTSSNNHRWDWSGASGAFVSGSSYSVQFRTNSSSGLYGFKVWDANGNVRLDTSNREFRYVAFYTGTVSANSSLNVTVSGMTNDGTWGLNETQGSSLDLEIGMGTNKFTLTNNSSSSAANYNVQVFKT